MGAEIRDISWEHADVLSPEEIVKASDVWRYLQIGWDELKKRPENREGRIDGIILFHESFDVVVEPNGEIMHYVNGSLVDENLSMEDGCPRGLVLKSVSVVAQPRVNDEPVPILTGFVRNGISFVNEAYALNPFDGHEFGIRYNGRPRDYPWEKTGLNADVKSLTEHGQFNLMIW
ncbi:hypothetical protein HYS84_01810 [Candidatus Saccharibacteria bacterium]|nr:hypothetical protein [Candidatus Saccharibacteria bacterium]